MTLCSNCHKAEGGIEWYYSIWERKGYSVDRIKKETLKWKDWN